MFSTGPTTPTALTLALRAGSSRIKPMTTAEPAMSHFISAIPAAGLIEMPPVSMVTPFELALEPDLEREARNGLATARVGPGEAVHHCSFSACRRRIKGFPPRLARDRRTAGESFVLQGWTCRLTP
jgi:hypothetical protein